MAGKIALLIFNELSKLGQGNLLFKTGLDIRREYGRNDQRSYCLEDS